MGSCSRALRQITALVLLNLSVQPIRKDSNNKHTNYTLNMVMLRQQLVMVIVVSVLPLCQGKGSCREAKKCCDGKDTDCAVSSSYINSLILNLSSESCYCDKGCLDMGDCCEDFKDFCGVSDCQVSDWSEWSSCSTECGQGKTSRTRSIERPAFNGGVSCPDLRQTRVCRGTSCAGAKKQNSRTSHKKTPSALRETGMLLPGKYSKLTQEEEEKYEVRENLKSFIKKENKDQYCVVFKVSKAMKACAGHEDTDKLIKGSEVCVSCESKATRPHLGDRCSGHGVDNKATRFKNVITPHCQGRWTRVEVTDRCPCPNGPDFIL